MSWGKLQLVSNAGPFSSDFWVTFDTWDRVGASALVGLDGKYWGFYVGPRTAGPVVARVKWIDGANKNGWRKLALWLATGVAAGDIMIAESIIAPAPGSIAETSQIVAATGINPYTSTGRFILVRAGQGAGSLSIKGQSLSAHTALTIAGPH